MPSRYLLLLVFLFTMCASVPKQTTTKLPRVEDLSLDEKVGQMFVHAGHGYFSGDSGWRYRDILRQVETNRIGGFIWFQSNVFETAWLTQKAQAASKIPMLISADLEAGIGMRFLDTTYWPTAMAVGATGDPKLAEEQGRITAREAKVLGINHIYAPVADVNVDPANPVINARSYGEDPEAVGRFVAAFIRGVQSEGVLATAKHFPGHGDTHTDSHRSLPVLSVDRTRLDQVELVPFRAAVAAGVASVMIGHLAVPALDKTPVPIRDHAESTHENPYATPSAEVTLDGSVPATLSRVIIEGLLRNELGFRGLIVSDAMDMGGLVAHYTAGEAAIQGILAGQDQILKSPNTDAAVLAVKEAVRSGRISEARIDQSVRRILDAKGKVGFAVGSMDEIFRTIDRKEHRAVATDIARRALTLLREEPGVLPLRKDARVMILSVSDFDEVANPLPDFARETASRLTMKPSVFLLDSRSPEEDAAPVLEAAQNTDIVILALGIRARSGAGHMLLPDVAKRAIAAFPPNVKRIAIAFGSPYILQSVPTLPTYIAAYGPQPVLQVAAAAAIFGEAPITGRLPVTIPGFYSRGSGLTR